MALFRLVQPDVVGVYVVGADGVSGADREGWCLLGDVGAGDVHDCGVYDVHLCGSRGDGPGAGLVAVYCCRGVGRGGDVVWRVVCEES